jgi:hypothetical protein
MMTLTATNSQGIIALRKLLNNASDKTVQDGLRAQEADGDGAEVGHALRTELYTSTATSTHGNIALHSVMMSITATNSQGINALRKLLNNASDKIGQDGLRVL